jgi:hypothetical protein
MQAYKDTILKIYDKMRQTKKNPGIALEYDLLARKHYAEQVKAAVPGLYYFTPTHHLCPVLDRNHLQVSRWAVL